MQAKRDGGGAVTSALNNILAHRVISIADPVLRRHTLGVSVDDTVWMEGNSGTSSADLRRLLRCGQRGDNAADNLPVQEHPVVANAADRYGLHFGVGRHRPETRHDHVGRGRECQPPHAVG